MCAVWSVVCVCVYVRNGIFPMRVSVWTQQRNLMEINTHASTQYNDFNWMIGIQYDKTIHNSPLFFKLLWLTWNDNNKMNYIRNQIFFRKITFICHKILTNNPAQFSHEQMSTVVNIKLYYKKKESSSGQTWKFIKFLYSSSVCRVWLLLFYLFIFFLLSGFARRFQLSDCRARSVSLVRFDRHRLCSFFELTPTRERNRKRGDIEEENELFVWESGNQNYSFQMKDGNDEDEKKNREREKTAIKSQDTNSSLKCI